MPLTYKLFDIFNITLNPFTNTNEGESSYFHINGDYFSSKCKYWSNIPMNHQLIDIYIQLMKVMINLCWEEFIPYLELTLT